MGADVSGRERARAESVRRGRRLEHLTIGWNSLEAMASILAGLLAGSVALTGFGFDSLIEVTSGLALVWRLRLDAPAPGRLSFPPVRIVPAEVV